MAAVTSQLSRSQGRFGGGDNISRSPAMASNSHSDQASGSRSRAEGVAKHGHGCLQSVSPRGHQQKGTAFPRRSLGAGTKPQQSRVTPAGLQHPSVRGSPTAHSPDGSSTCEAPWS